MSDNTVLPFAYRVVGQLSGPRRLVDAAAAFTGYASCDSRASIEREGHLSAFNYGAEFGDWLAGTGSTKGFDGLCWAAWIWWDIDRAGNLAGALEDARRLTSRIQHELDLGSGETLIQFSGGKGFHVGLPTFWNPQPCGCFHQIARTFAERIAESAGVKIDPGIYRKTSSLRAPNSRHPKTGLHKRHLEPGRLGRTSEEELRALARKPMPFEPPRVQPRDGVAAEYWQAATRIVEDNREARGHHQGKAHLNRLTLDFICSGAPEGERERRLFSAAANLAEFGCPQDLTYALLSDAARDSGLTPSEIRHNIDGGLRNPLRTQPAKEAL